MQKRFFLFLITLGALVTYALNISAQQISVEEASRRAAAFKFTSTSDATQRRTASKSANVSLAYTAQNADEVHFYVFNYDEGGWVMIGGDEVCQEVLAYSDQGSFKYENCPSNLKMWLQGYEKEISSCIAYVNEQEALGNKVPRKGVRTASKGNKINALIQTHWDQNAPYWNMCPKESGRTCYTGCVATAMAQVMYYHKWPKVGKGSKTYTDSQGCGQKLSTNFSEHTYGWDLMQLETSQYKTTDSKNAVAQLMYDCGVSVEMMYTNEGSGAYSEDIDDALKTYFDYDKTSVKFVQKDNYSADPWAQLIYDELAAGRPVLYSGADGTGPNAGGHQFVCDGYEYKSSADYFHFNWGWSGADDGFFTLKTVGPTGAQFKYAQDAVIGIIPNEPKFYTVTLDDDSTQLTPEVAGGSVTLPVRSMEGYAFCGWGTEDIKELTTKKPATLLNGNYTPTKNITLYPVYSFTEEKGGSEPVTVLTEDFSSVKDGDNTTTGGSGTEWTGNANFPTLVKVNQAGGAVRLGTSKSRGYLTSKELEIQAGQNVTVNFDVKGWSTVEGDIEVSLGSGTTKTTVTYTNTLDQDFESKSVSFVAEESSPTVTIASTAKRVFIDNVSITVGGKAKITYYFTHHSIPTDIEEVETPHQETLFNAPAYSLSGQRVGDNYRGIVIVNGKKYLR